MKRFTVSYPRDSRAKSKNMNKKYNWRSPERTPPDVCLAEILVARRLIDEPLHLHGHRVDELRLFVCVRTATISPVQLLTEARNDLGRALIQFSG